MKSGLYGLQDRIEVPSIAELHELFAKVSEVQSARYVDDHLYREHERTRMCSRVNAGGDLGDVDTPRRAEPRERGDDTRLIEAHGIDRVGQLVSACSARVGAMQVQCKTGFGREVLKLGFELGNGVPIAGHQQNHGEFVAEARHAALADVAAAVADDSSEVVDETGTVWPDGRDGKVLLHSWAPV